MDIASSLLENGDGELLGRIVVDGAIEDDLFIEDEGNLSSITFSECVFGRVYLEGISSYSSIPRFGNCVIGVLSGIGREDGVPESFSSADISSVVTGSETNDAIMTLNLAEPAKVLLTVLNKVHIQKGSGRQTSALYRGLDPRASKFVPEVLKLVEKEGLATCARMRGKEVWLPNRSLSGRVKRILSAPLLSKDPIMTMASAI